MGVLTEGVDFLPERSSFVALTAFWTKPVAFSLGGLFAFAPFAAGNEVAVFVVRISVLAGGGGVGVRAVAVWAVGVTVVVEAVVDEAVFGGALGVGAFAVWVLLAILFFSF